jgi:hypothetical protein
MVVFGRPKGDRDSYRQWEEDNIAPQVVFEILSPSNTLTELLDKSLFYANHGVQEYYIYDPDAGELYGFVRDESGHLRRVAEMRGWVSPLLGVRFELEGGELVVVRPDGERFVGYEELAAALEQERLLREQERARAEQEHQRAEQERLLREQPRAATRRAGAATPARTRRATGAETARTGR